MNRTNAGVPIMEMSWEDFVRFFVSRDRGEGGGRRLFRGQVQSTWGLEPGLRRQVHQVPLEEYLDVIVPEAYRLLAGKIPELDLSREPELHRLLGILQHHGFPTPLLDWTFSPYFAAYFAFSELGFAEPNSEHVAVWSLNGEFVADFAREKTGAAPFDVIMPDGRDNDRLLAQDALFTRSLVDSPLDVAIGSLMTEHEHPGLLQQILIPSRQARIALEHLATMGIHSGTLFPGLGGTCGQLKQYFFMSRKYLMTETQRKLIEDTVNRARKEQ